LIQPLEDVTRPDDEAEDGSLLPRQQIQEELEAALRESASRHGAKILGVALRNVELVDDIAQQWIETWRAEWKKRIRTELAPAKAERERRLAVVKAEAQQNMIVTILESLQRLAKEGRPVASDVVIMRFLETLQRVAGDPRSYPLLPHTRQVIDSLQLLRDIVE
jgi:hypothetical protein